MAEDENQKDPQNGPPCELVIDEDRNDNALENEQGFYFGPAWVDLLIARNANNHIDCHHESLQADVNLFGAISK